MAATKQIAVAFTDWQKQAMMQVQKDVGIRIGELIRRAVVKYLAEMYGVSEVNETVGDK